eukprot:CAMPEP_0196810048 /NCGR_PEP_ID=MMETSP1362-20130617/9887_1 /TAXON_ID=163516 /ORGANISM="Leptocylindrus danicus, Strain CCMP1856" /LENGTH=299 /DNA_ID=CAMNT_0042184911 /DNA_START=298 /DNA_END=1197 /DNA_ORIENTATION=+
MSPQCSSAAVATTCTSSPSSGTPIIWPDNTTAVNNRIINEPSCLGAVMAFSEPLKLPPGCSSMTNDMDLDGKHCCDGDMDCSDDSDTEMRDRLMLTDDAQVDIEDPVISSVTTTTTTCNAYPRSSLVASPTYSRSVSTPSFVSEAECTSSTGSTSSSSTNISLDDHSSHSNSHGSLVSSCSSKSSFSTGNLCQLSDGRTVILRKNRKRSRRVSIDRAVSVMPIPSRGEYPELVRERLWSNPLEMYQNAARNSIEFAAEGWDWRKVYEDENMYVCSQSGELIHPIHYYLSTMSDANPCSR